MSNSVTFTWNQQVLDKLKTSVVARMLSMGYKIQNTAKGKAPYLTGALVNSIRIDTSKDNTVYVIAGGKIYGRSVPYAKRREYENHAHPSTRYYMRDSFRDTTRNYQTFFKDLTV